MVIFLENGTQIRGDLLISAVLRSDLSPIPGTLEAEVKSGDDDFDAYLQQGKTLTVGADSYYIVKSERASARVSQGIREQAGYRLTALLDACKEVAYVRSRAIITENAALSAIYRAAGAKLRAVDADFPVPRFTCPVGDTPSFHIARILQEEGGVVRWKAGRLQFLRLSSLLQQKPTRSFSDAATENMETGFVAHHEIPWFVSLDEAGAFVLGNQTKPRPVLYSPFKNAQRLRNMTRCLILRKRAKTLLDTGICAGDVVAFSGQQKMVVMTAAHVWKTDNGGGATQTYSRLWLGELEQ